MRPRILTVAVLTLVACATADAQPAPGGPPQLVVAKASRTSLSWAVTTIKTTYVEEKIKVVVDGVEQERTVKVPVQVSADVAVTAPLKGLKVTDGTGQPIDAGLLPARLGQGTAVVLHTGPLPAAYRRLLKDDAVVVELTAGPAP